MDKNLRDINEDEVVSIFSEHNILDYLNEHYEVLHTQSRQWLIAEIDVIINKSI